MNIHQFKEKVTETIVEPMISFMEDWDEDACNYTREDVEKCETLILEYLNTLEGMHAPADDEIMEQVKTLVLALNELNESVDYSLMETEAREAIWEVIQSSAVECGLQKYSHDITEEWREW